ncbi:MAG: hypothetical protein ACE5PT_05665 [Gemmatimonadales bacterium]
MRRSLTRLAAVSTLALLAPACDFGPDAGKLTWSLATAAQNTGGVAFEVTAPEAQTIDTVLAACAGCQLFTLRMGDDAVRGVVVGTIGVGDLVTAEVSDVGSPELYTLRLIEAASTTYQPLSITEFQLTLQER